MSSENENVSPVEIDNPFEEGQTITAQPAVKENLPTKSRGELEHLSRDEKWQKMKELATLWKASQFIPKGVSPTDAVVIVGMGRELGLKAFESLTNIYVVDGKPCLATKLMQALVRRRYPNAFMRTTEMSLERGAFKCGHSEESAFEYEFTKQEAMDAGLWNHPKKTPWQKYKKSMLLVRAKAIALRAEFPECFIGIGYSVEEMQDSGDIIDARSVNPADEVNQIGGSK